MKGTALARLDLIIDRVEAARVRIEHFKTVEGYDEGALSHWASLCEEAVAEATKLRETLSA